MYNIWKIIIRFFFVVFFLGIYLTFIFVCIFLPNIDVYFIVWGAFILNYLISVILCFYIINSKRFQAIKFVWIVWLILIPFFSQLMFIVWGVSGIKRRTIEQYKKDIKKYLKYENYQLNNHLLKNKDKTENFHGIFSYLASSCNRPIYYQNKIEFLSKPHLTLTKIIEILEKAEKFIHLEYYYISIGLVWKCLFDVLKKKSDQGVEVRIIIDYLGSLFELKKSHIKELKKAGIKIVFFNAPRIPKNISLLNFRCHKKVIIVDNKYAVYGGANLCDAYFGVSDKIFPMTDFGYYIEGAIVNSFNLLFAYDWNIYCSNFKNKKNFLNEPHKYFQIYQPKNISCMAQLVESNPDVTEKILVNNLTQLILRAKKSIIITTPYFFPTLSIINALKIASHSGVKIKILLPLHPDYKSIVLTMNRYYYEPLLEAGVEIYEYCGFNHEKIMVIDNSLIYTGTYNWDFRSLFMNYETILLIKNLKLAKEHEFYFNERLKNTQQVSLADIKKWNTFKQRCLYQILHLIYPLI